MRACVRVFRGRALSGLRSMAPSRKGSSLQGFPRLTYDLIININVRMHDKKASREVACPVVLVFAHGTGEDGHVKKVVQTPGHEIVCVQIHQNYRDGRVRDEDRMGERGKTSRL